MTKDKCQFCSSVYPDTVGQIIKEGNVVMCRDCYERLVFEKLSVKKAHKRIMACKGKSKGKKK